MEPSTIGCPAPFGLPVSRTWIVNPSSRSCAAHQSAAFRTSALYAGSVLMLGILSQSIRREIEEGSFLVRAATAFCVDMKTLRRLPESVGGLQDVRLRQRLVDREPI